MDDMKEGIAFARVWCESLCDGKYPAHNDDLGVRTYFEELKEINRMLQSFADPGVFEIAKEVCLEIERHRTQANNTNYGTYNFWYRQGASRVVSARELSMEELRELRANIPQDLEIETFIHGAMCISYSGRCLLSNYFTGRDANRGACTHPCRWKYAVVEETRPGEYMPVYENERGTYIFNSKDLCMIEHIPELIDAGIDSLKIEGRMKTALYVATVARTYRRALDDYRQDPKLYEKYAMVSGSDIQLLTDSLQPIFLWKARMRKYRSTTATLVKEYTYLGDCLRSKDGLCRIEQRNKFSVGGDHRDHEAGRKRHRSGRAPDSVRRRGRAGRVRRIPKQVLYVDLEWKGRKNMIF